MIYGRHTGLNVSSLDVALKFYVDVLGMTLVEQRIEEGPYIDKLTGIRNAKVRWAKVATRDGYLLELVKWLEPASGMWPLDYMVAYDRHGINHLCFCVDSVEDVHRCLREKGYLAREIQTDPPGKVKNFAAYDPDGNIIEFVEVLK